MEVSISLGKKQAKPEEKGLIIQPLPNGNQEVIHRWLHGRSPATQDAYRCDLEKFLRFVQNKSLNTVTLGDLQDFADSLASFAPASQARILSAVKSVLTFGCKTMPAYFPINAGAALQLPKVKNTLAERILEEDEVHKLLAKEENQRDHALIRLLYGAGLRRAEVIGLYWRDLQPSRTNEGQPTGQVQVYGKGGKTRYILLTPATWRELQALPGTHPLDEPVFKSRQRDEHGNVRGLSRAQVNTIVRRAADQARLGKAVSPHWLRHSHASHALNRKAPISLVQATLGHANIQTTGRYLHARPDDSSAQYLTI